MNRCPFKRALVQKEMHTGSSWMWTSVANSIFYNITQYAKRDSRCNRSLSYLPNPSARAGYDTRSILKRSLTGLNSEFSIS